MTPEPPNLGGAVPLGMDAAIEQLSAQIGLLCGACGNPISTSKPLEIRSRPGEAAELQTAGPPAYEYLSFNPVIHGAETGISLQKLVICERSECAEARAEARKEAVARRPFRPWEHLDD